MSELVVALVEGEHDMIFFKESLKLRGRLNVKTVKFALVANQIRSAFQGTVLAGCQGADNLQRAINRLMTDVIRNISMHTSPRLVAIGDGDKFSAESVRRKMKDFVDTPDRYYESKFVVSKEDSRVQLKELVSGDVLQLECYVVPQSLEDQIYATVPSNVKTQIAEGLSLDEKLRSAAARMGMSLNTLVEQAASSLAKEDWSSVATSAILV